MCLVVLMAPNRRLAPRTSEREAPSAANSSSAATSPEKKSFLGIAQARIVAGSVAGAAGT